MPNPETTHELDELRDNVTAKLGELHRRATHARLALSPSSYWRQPWLRLGLGVALGYAIGRRATTTLGTPGTPAAHETIVHAVLRAGLAAAAAVLVTRALKQLPVVSPE
jgi:hypothetical protein